MEGAKKEMKNGVITNATEWRSRKLQGYTTFQGLPISIENERGSYREGKDSDGHMWRTFMHMPYGYIRLTEGTDGDHVDCYIGPNKHSEKVFVIHQQDPDTKKYDEDKVMLGYNTAAEAKAAYIRQYDRPGFFQSMNTYDMATFKQMLKDRQGMKLKKSLTPQRKLITRGGKTFMTTVYVATTKKEQKEQSRKTEVALAPKERRRVPESTVSLMKDQRKIIDYAPNDKLAVDKMLAFQKEHFKGKEKPSIYDVVNIATEEVESALQGSKSGSDWYKEAMDETRATLSTHYPDLAADNEWDFFLSLLAITSPTQAPTANLRTAVTLYDQYTKTGELPEKSPKTGKAYSMASTAMVKQFKKTFSKFPDKKSFVQFMNGVSTVGELNSEYGSNISGKKDEAAFNSMVFGEKVGMFYQSMRGTEGAVAVDRWAIRSYYRWTGELKEGMQTGSVGGDRIRAIDDKMSVGERKNVEYVMQTVADKLGLVPSEAQAVMWFYEKRLYQKLGMDRGAVATDTFSDAANKLFLKKSNDSELIDALKRLNVEKRLPSFEMFIDAIMNITGDMYKAQGRKYIRKYFKNGRWNYIYPNSGGTRRPRSMPEHEVQSNLGGTTGGAMLVRMPNGERKVVKQSTSKGHLKEEYMANRIYETLGVPVPRVSLRQSSKGLVQVADYIEGTPLSDLSSEERVEAEESLREGFVADALLGNWDVLGMDEDNIIWDGSKAWRIDNGGSMRYRAQGAPKGDKFGPEVVEIDTLREPERRAAHVFDVSDEQIAEQVQNIMSKKQKILDSIDDPNLRKIMERRINSLTPLSKAKYIKRWRGKDGKWNYLYPEDKKERPKRTGGEAGTVRGMTPKERDRVLKSFRRRAPGDGKEKTIQKKEHLDLLLRESTYCMMSAGRNPKDPEDMKLSDAQIKQRYDNLLSDLKERGYVFSRCKGKYENPEKSIMVMAHDADRDDMMELGEKYKQDSIVFSEEGKGELIYTTGEKKGKAEMAGEGFEYVPDADDFYTEMPLADGSVVKFTVLLEEVAKALGMDWVPDGTLLKHQSGQWYLYEYGMLTKFYWFYGLEKAVKTKTYYSPEEVKARGMRWVTIRGAHVLVQGTSDGGYVVVGGAGGKLNHLKIDKLLGKEEYKEKRRKIEAKRKEETEKLTKEELKEQAEQRKLEIQAKKQAREAYTEQVTDILGVSKEDIRSEITANEMDELTERARAMVENRKKAKTMDEKALEKEVEDQTEKEVQKEMKKKVKNIERQALETLMNDYMPTDPNAKPELKKLLDSDKAKDILAARKQFRKKMKEIGKTGADTPTDLKVGSVFAGASDKDIADIEAEVKEQLETAKNISMYDTLNAQSDSINTHIHQGAISALNGLISDVYGGGATFSDETVKELGLEAVVRAVTIKLQEDGKGEAVRKALEEYVGTEREKTVDGAMKEYERRMKNADDLRALAKDTDDAEAILSMASANGHALKQITAAQRALGTAVGSLRSAAHMINALEDPPADVVQVDMGKDLARARKRARAAGLQKGTYNIRTQKQGRGKRLVLELPKEHLDNFFKNNQEMTDTNDKLSRIKTYKENTGYIPPGFKENIKLDPAQEAGLHFFREQGRVLLDFEAGLGKTATAYAAAMDAIHNNGAKKVLIVAPSGPAGDFYNQRKTFLTPDMQKIVKNSAKGSSAKKRKDIHTSSAEDGPMIHIVTQDSLRNDADLLKEAGYDMVVVDEIHEMTAGSGGASRYKALQKLDEVPMKIAMSGTNIKNSKEELYRKINFIDPDHTLGTMAEFKRKYKGLNQGTGIFSDAANDAFRKQMGQWMYTQKNHLPIDNKTQTHRIPLSAEQRRKYAESERNYRDARARGERGASARRDVRNYNILTDMGDENNAKLDKLVNIMNESHQGEKAVIHVSRPMMPIKKAMRTTITRLEKEYGEGCVGIIDGDTSGPQLNKIKAAFNDPGNPMRFIIGTKTLESGHNLQGGGTVTFHLDIPDSQASFDQRNARVFRKGQDRDTSTYVLSGNNPMDMRSEDILETKKKEMGILGNPREVDAMDETGFIGLLKRYETEAREESA